MNTRIPFTGAETLTVLCETVRILELKRLSCTIYCPISQTAPYAAFHITKLINLKHHPYSANDMEAFSIQESS